MNHSFGNFNRHSHEQHTLQEKHFKKRFKNIFLTLGGPGINTTSLDRVGYFNPHMQKCYLLIPKRAIDVFIFPYIAF